MPIPKGQLPDRVNGQPPQEHVRVEKTPPPGLDLTKLVERAREIEAARETDDTPSEP